jgi:hypothetical protein
MYMEINYIHQLHPSTIDKCNTSSSGLEIRDGDASFAVSLSFYGNGMISHPFRSVSTSNNSTKAVLYFVLGHNHLRSRLEGSHNSQPISRAWPCGRPSHWTCCGWTRLRRLLDSIGLVEEHLTLISMMTRPCHFNKAGSWAMVSMEAYMRLLARDCRLHGKGDIVGGK